LLGRPGTEVNEVNQVEGIGKEGRLHIEGESPLCYAARKNYDEIVDLLLQHNADPKEPETRGLTALHHEASNNYPKVITLLLEAGVDPFITSQPRFDDAGVEPALMLACSHGHVEAVTSFLPHLKASDSVSLALRVRMGSRVQTTTNCPTNFGTPSGEGNRQNRGPDAFLHCL
jgi:ankyrin repeat protein